MRRRPSGRGRTQSRAGRGTTVRFSLPFAILMSRVLTVEAGGQLFGIPLEAVLETVRVRRGDIHAVGAARADLKPVTRGQHLRSVLSVRTHSNSRSIIRRRRATG